MFTDKIKSVWQHIFAAGTRPVKPVTPEQRRRMQLDGILPLVIEYLDEDISPFVAIGRTDRLVSQLELDSLDLRALLAHFSRLTGARLSVDALFRRYGYDPSVAQLARYITDEAAAA